MREGEHSYQVCLGCGIKRLFDEKKFRGYGPYGDDVKKLIAREQAVRARQRRILARGGCGTCRGRDSLERSGQAFLLIVLRFSPSEI
jgi:hypothetical protein